MKPPLQTPFLNMDPFQQWYRIENVTKVKINGASCMSLLDYGAQVNTIMPRYVNEHSLQVGPITDLMGSKVTCVGLGKCLHSTIRLRGNLGSGVWSLGL